MNEAERANREVYDEWKARWAQKGIALKEVAGWFRDAGEAEYADWLDGLIDQMEAAEQAPAGAP